MSYSTLHVDKTEYVSINLGCYAARFELRAFGLVEPGKCPRVLFMPPSRECFIVVHAVTSERYLTSTIDRCGKQLNLRLANSSLAA